jgi:crotonobetainyl-CoA:carnitine CoA-transferase CaiB-like acyl-CoA transferase
LGSRGWRAAIYDAASNRGNEAMSYAAPFAGLKVIDLSQGVAGPYCAMLLGQYGANVIKVEPTDTGDWSRGLGTRYGDQTAYSIPANLGKRSIALDLKQDAGRDVLWRLVRGADVFVQGFRPGVIDRLGFGYAAVQEREPRILYVSISGFGQTGPLAERPAMDPVLQAYTGLMAENQGEDGIPHRTPIIAIDMSTGMYTFGAVAAALHARQHAPAGRHIEASLMQAAAGLQVIRMLGSYLEQGAPRPVIPPSGVYKTADGWMSITVVRPFEWEGYCRALDLPQILAETRFGTTEGRQTHAEELNAVLRPLLFAGTSADWSARLASQRVMHERLNSYTQFLQQAHVAESGAMAWIKHPHVPQPLPMPNLIGLPPFEDGSLRSIAPGKGQHSAAILAEHGFSTSAIADLAARDVVVLGAAPS